MREQLIFAINKGDTEKVNRIVLRNRHLILGTSGVNILSAVVETENIDIIRLLIQLGITINDEKGEIYNNEVPLSIACRNGNIETVKLLLDFGAWTDNIEGDYESLSPLMCAVFSENLEIVKLLVEKGANVDVIRDGGSTALSMAVDRNHQDIIDYLTPITTVDIEAIMNQECNRPYD